jgi:hypothetical protein
MNEVTLHAFWDELTKISATVDALGKGFKRLGVTRVPGLKKGGKWLMDNAAQELGGMSSPAQMQARHLVLMGGGAVTVPTKGMLGHMAPGFERAAKNTLGDTPETVAIARQGMANAQAMPKKPAILLPKGGAPQLQSQMGIDVPTNPQAMRAHAYAFGHHEGFERAVKPHEQAYGHGHLSPNVLMKEHNMLSKMTGAGAEEARAGIRGLRETAGDMGAVRGGAERLYGPQASQFFGPDQRVPKAMMKDFTRRAVAGEVPEWSRLSGM